MLVFHHYIIEEHIKSNGDYVKDRLCSAYSLNEARAIVKKIIVTHYEERVITDDEFPLVNVSGFDKYNRFRIFWFERIWDFV